MALSRTLPAFAAERRLKAPAAIDRYLLQTPALSSKPLLLSIDGTDRRTDGWTPDRYIDPAQHTMRAASVMSTAEPCVKQTR